MTEGWGGCVSAAETSNEAPYKRERTLSEVADEIEKRAIAEARGGLTYSTGKARDILASFAVADRLRLIAASGMEARQGEDAKQTSSRSDDRPGPQSGRRPAMSAAIEAVSWFQMWMQERKG